MHDELFKRPAVIARYRAGPYAEPREHFLKQARAEGYSHSTLERVAWVLLIVAGAVQSYGGSISLTASSWNRVGDFGRFSRPVSCGPILLFDRHHPSAPTYTRDLPARAAAVKDGPSSGHRISGVSLTAASTTA